MLNHAQQQQNILVSSMPGRNSLYDPTRKKLDKALTNDIAGIQIPFGLDFGSRPGGGGLFHHAPLLPHTGTSAFTGNNMLFKFKFVGFIMRVLITRSSIFCIEEFLGFLIGWCVVWMGEVL